MARQTCSSCGGSGKTSTACPRCNGMGWISGSDNSSEKCPYSNCNGGRIEERCSACGGSGYIDDGRSDSSSSSDSSGSFTPSSSSGSTPSTPNAKKIASEQFFNQAVEAEKQGNYSEAIALYTKSINGFGDVAYHTVTYAKRGQAYFNLKQYDNALDDFEKAFEGNQWTSKSLSAQSKGAIFYMVGFIYDNKSLREEAIKYYGKAVDLGNAEAKQRLAEMDKEKAELEKSAQNKGLSLLEEADQCFNAGNYDKAIAKCTMATRQGKNKAQALMKRAACYAKKGEKEQAIDDYTDAINSGLSGSDLANAKAELAKLK